PRHLAAADGAAARPPAGDHAPPATAARVAGGVHRRRGGVRPRHHAGRFGAGPRGTTARVVAARRRRAAALPGLSPVSAPGGLGAERQSTPGNGNDSRPAPLPRTRADSNRVMFETRCCGPVHPQERPRSWGRRALAVPLGHRAERTSLLPLRLRSLLILAF